MTAIDHGSGLRIAQITTGPLNDIHSFWISIATVWTLEAPLGWLKIALKITLVALIDWRIGPQIPDPVIGIVPNCFKGLGILLENRVLTVMDKTA